MPLAARVPHQFAARLGRFEVLRELGRGAQGTVYLARDTHLGRQVALKTVNVAGSDAAQRAALVQTLLDEARIVSKLQHPNLVTLHDAGEQDGLPYLVFEYVEGGTLAQRLRAKERIAPPPAAAIALGVLRGLACAHAMKVLHRDVKPANILLAADDVPRVMDFGIARHAALGEGRESGLAGTPRYMAPEYIAGGPFEPASDVFSVGVVLYEMLAGRPPVDLAGDREILHAILRDEFAPPSRFCSEVDESLDALVMKALAKRPDERFASAEHMIEALERYMSPQSADEGGAATGGTLQFLLRRMRHKSDFPALSNTVSSINRITLSDREPVGALCNAILKDLALTARLLRLVNTAHYTRHGGGIRTVTRAIAVLGFDQVRNITMSLLLFDHLQNRAQAVRLKDEVAASYFSGVLARDLALRNGSVNPEEAFICAMFQRLGRLLVAFYLVDEKAAIERLALARGCSESAAAQEVLGLGYEELGMGVARHWNFPDTIVSAMQPLEGELPDPAAFKSDPLRVVAALASDLCDTARAGSPRERGLGLEALQRRYGRGLPLDGEVVRDTLKSSFEVVARESVLMGVGSAVAPLMSAARHWEQSIAQPAGEPAAPPAVPEEATTSTLIEFAQLPEGGAETGRGPSPAAEPAPAEHSRGIVLSAGVQDITQVLAGDFRLNDVLNIILETMYRAIGFKRVLLCVRDAQRNALRARFGLGDRAEAIVRAGFAVPLDGPPDVFFAATRNGVDLCIEDLDSERIRAYVPQWYRQAIPARGLVLFPVMLRGRAVALIYGDTDRPDALRFSTEELNLLRTLRSQAVLALKQAG